MKNISGREFCVAAGAATATLFAGAPRIARAAARPALPIPKEQRPDAHGAIALTAVAGSLSFLPGVETPTYGFNGSYLGPPPSACPGVAR